MKRLTTAAALMLAMLAASACEPRYEMQTIDGGVSYILDRQLGEVWFCRPQGCQRISSLGTERRSP